MAACGGECLAIQACIETVCRALSGAGSPDEGACQVQCQTTHSLGRTAHLDVANCGSSAACSPPCEAAPADHERCRTERTAGECAYEQAACAGSTECAVYRACTDTCTTLAECVACGAGTTGVTGRSLFEAYELCLAGGCIAEAWLP